jgi:hypothetical protein
MFIGYRPDRYKLFVCDPVGRDGAASPARSTCRRSASSTPARCRPANSIEVGRSGWRSAAAARWSAPSLGAFLVNGAKSWFTGALPGLLAVLPRRAVHRW